MIKDLTEKDRAELEDIIDQHGICGTKDCDTCILFNDCMGTHTDGDTYNLAVNYLEILDDNKNSLKIGDKVFYAKVCPDHFVDEVYLMEGLITKIDSIGVDLEMEVGIPDQCIEEQFLGKTRIEALEKVKKVLDVFIEMEKCYEKEKKILGE